MEELCGNKGIRVFLPTLYFGGLSRIVIFEPIQEFEFLLSKPETKNCTVMQPKLGLIPRKKELYNHRKRDEIQDEILLMNSL